MLELNQQLLASWNNQPMDSLLQTMLYYMHYNSMYYIYCIHVKCVIFCGIFIITIDSY